MEEKNGGTNTDNADWPVVLKELRFCATCWDDEARIVGNIRAKDIWRATLMVEAELQKWKRKAEELEGIIGNALL